MADATRRTRPRLLYWLLGLSLCVNLLVFGAVGGAVLRHGGAPEGRPGPAAGGLALIRALDRADRRAVLRAARGAVPGGVARSAVNADMLRVLRAETLDAAALGAVLDAQAAGAQARVDAVRAAWRTRVEAMSPDARAAYADRLERLQNRRRDDAGGL